MKLLFVLALTFIAGSTPIFSQCDSTKYKSCDTLTIPVFDGLVKKSLKLMKKNENNTICELIQIVKIYQTFSFDFHNYYERKTIYKKYIDYYQHKYAVKVGNALGVVFLRGLVAYSEKYNLYLSMTKDKIPCFNYFVLKR